MLFQIIDDEVLRILTSQNEKNQEISNNTTKINGGGVGRSIKNLSIVAKLAKSKKSDLLKANFIKINSFGTDFLTLKAKKTFIHLWKTITKALILKYFDLKYHIQIEIDALGYAISEVLDQMTLNQYFSGHRTYKDRNSKSKIS